MSDLQEQEDFKKRKYLSALASFQEELEQIGVVRTCSPLLRSCSIPGGRGVRSLFPASLLLPVSLMSSVSHQNIDRWSHREEGHVQGLVGGTAYSRRLP